MNRILTRTESQLIVDRVESQHPDLFGSARHLFEPVNDGYVSFRLQELARRCGVERISRRKMTCDAQTTDRDGGLEIWLNEEDRRPESNFSVAHEIAHILLDGYAFESEKALERACDDMAARILVPSHVLSQLTRDISPSLKFILEFADRLAVSSEALIGRIQDELGWQVAFIQWRISGRPGNPIHKLRIERTWSPRESRIFIPKHVSAAPASNPTIALRNGYAAPRTESFALGSLRGAFRNEARRLGRVARKAPAVLQMIQLAETH